VTNIAGPTLKTEVIIVGAGPTGLALGCQLARFGVDFVLIEKNPGVTQYSKALGVHARTLEIYEQIDLAENAVQLGTVAGKLRMLESGEILGEVDLSSVGYGLSAYPYLLVLEQSKNEELMYRWLKSQQREVLWQSELKGFFQDANTVTAQVTQGSDSLNLVAKYLVGCDGPRSLVRQTLGLEFQGSTFARVFYVADVHINWKFSHDALHLCLAPAGVVAFFPLPGENRWRIVGAFPEGLEKEEGEILYEEIEARIKEEAHLELDITHVDWFSTYKVHTRHVERFSSARCFLAGDSAHIHTPVGGQGMNTGIQDAYNLAWKLALVIKHSAAERLLETYNEERLPNAKRLTATTDRVFNIAVGKDWLLSLIRTTIFPPMAKYLLGIEAVRRKFFRIISQIGINYRDGSLSDHAGDAEFEVKAGDRLPYLLIGGKSIFHYLRAPRFHLIRFLDDQSEVREGPKPAIQPNQEAPLKYASLIDRHDFPLYPQVAEAFGVKKSFQVFLRPDNYIAFISHDTSSQPLSRYLERLS